MPKFSGPFKLAMKFIGATLDRNTDMMGKMDPYVAIEFFRGAAAPRKWRGPTHKGGHKTPSWNWETELYYGGDVSTISNETIKITVFEEDMSSSDLVGETVPIPISTFVGQGLKQMT